MTRDFTFVENVVQINVRALTTTNPEALNQVYNVGCNERITIMDLYTNIRDITTSNSEGVHRDPREGDIRNSLADISKAQQLLDYEPVFKLKEGLSITIDSFLK
jgi:UDP-N-acetylglucosamine 4-epimerase